tara:strand:- start:1223 stop:2170 length:948 start_codon:yes stop_codon:yes gene_type:complete
VKRGSFMKHLLSIKDLVKQEILDLTNFAQGIKKSPKKYATSAFEKNLLMMFEAPSLRTRISFETAMVQMGGDSINYHMEHSPWGHGKESIEDSAKTISRYVDIAMARIYSHEELVKFAASASVPIINAMTNFEHPCQTLGDLLTITEKKKKLKGLTLTYVGDSNNNVTNSLLYGCAKVGININIACPKRKEFSPVMSIVKEARTFAKKERSSVNIYNDVKKAVKNADIIYTDSWMSYRIPKAQKAKRIKVLKPFQVTKKVMSYAKKNAIFMHCLPAKRGLEVSADVIDSPQSVVFDQAENRLHTEKAILLWLLKG